jgi:transcriptional regulator with XRE-family HTH domain
MKNLRAIRKRQGLTQKKLAELVSFKQQAIARFERGTTSPAWASAIRIADALGCSLDELAGRIEPTHIVAERNLLAQRLNMSGKWARKIAEWADKGATP